MTHKLPDYLQPLEDMMYKAFDEETQRLKKAAELRKKQERYADLGRQLEQSLGIERALNSLGIPFEWPVRLGVIARAHDRKIKALKVNGVMHQLDEPITHKQWEALQQGGEG